MTQVQDEHQFNPEKLSQPEFIMGGRASVIVRGVDRIEQSVADNYSVAPKNPPLRQVNVDSEQAFSRGITASSLDAVQEARQKIEALHGGNQDA